MWVANKIVHANMLFYPLYYDIISLTSLRITQASHLLLGFAENPIASWYFNIRNSVRITEGCIMEIQIIEVELGSMVVSHQ